MASTHGLCQPQLPARAVVRCRELRVHLQENPSLLHNGERGFHCEDFCSAGTQGRTLVPVHTRSLMTEMHIPPVSSLLSPRGNKLPLLCFAVQTGKARNCFNHPTAEVHNPTPAAVFHPSGEDEVGLASSHCSALPSPWWHCSQSSLSSPKARLIRKKAGSFPQPQHMKGMWQDGSYHSSPQCWLCWELQLGTR